MTERPEPERRPEPPQRPDVANRRRRPPTDERGKPLPNSPRGPRPKG